MAVLSMYASILPAALWHHRLYVYRWCLSGLAALFVTINGLLLALSLCFHYSDCSPVVSFASIEVLMCDLLYMQCFACSALHAVLCKLGCCTASPSSISLWYIPGNLPTFSPLTTNLQSTVLSVCTISIVYNCYKTHHNIHRDASLPLIYRSDQN